MLYTDGEGRTRWSTRGRMAMGPTRDRFENSNGAGFVCIGLLQAADRCRFDPIGKRVMVQGRQAGGDYLEICITRQTFNIPRNKRQTRKKLRNGKAEKETNEEDEGQS